MTKATPNELWIGRSPKLSHIRVWGSGVPVRVPNQNRSKLILKQLRIILLCIVSIQSL